MVLTPIFRELDTAAVAPGRGRAAVVIPGNPVACGMAPVDGLDMPPVGLATGAGLPPKGATVVWASMAVAVAAAVVPAVATTGRIPLAVVVAAVVPVAAEPSAAVVVVRAVVEALRSSPCAPN